MIQASSRENSGSSAGDTVGSLNNRCINCLKCVKACPEGLLPNYLRAVSVNDTEQTEFFGINNCRKCGICDKICNSNRESGRGIAMDLFAGRLEALCILGSIPLHAGAMSMYGVRVIWFLVASLITGFLVSLAVELRGTPGKTALNAREILKTCHIWFLFPLFIPPGIPVWMCCCALAFSLLFFVFAFGGYGRNIVNPFAMGAVFLALGYPGEASLGYIKPFGLMFDNFFATTAGVSLGVNHETFLVRMINDFSSADILLGRIPGMLGAGFPAYSAVLLIMLYGCGVIGIRWAVGALTALSASGLLFAALSQTSFPAPSFIAASGVIMVVIAACADPASLPRTLAGRWITGTVFGILAFAFFFVTMQTYALFFALLMTNIITPLTDWAVIRHDHGIKWGIA